MIEQKKDGFTLIELLGILVLLAIIGLISFKVIDSSLKKGKNDAYEKQLKMIELSAKNYMSEHSDKLPNVGSKTYVTLGFLKVFGFSEMKVVNPKNKKCFSNDLTIVVTKPTSDADYVYEIDRNTIKEVDDCGVTDVSTEEPSVSISGGAEYVAHDGGQVSYTVAYNKSVSDAQANEYIKYYDSNLATSSEFKINEEQSVANGYSREVIINYKGGYPSGAKFYVEALEGLVTIGNRKSPYVKSNDLYVSGIAPIIEVEDIGIVSGSEVVFDVHFDDLPEDYHYVTWKANACFNGKYRFNQAINVKVTNKEYVKYTILDHSETYEKAESTDVTTIFSPINGTFTLTACDNVNNCSSKDITFNREDCLAPIIAKTLSDTDSETYITDFFKDQDADAANNTSGIGQIYAFIHPYQNLQTSSEIAPFPDTGIYSPFYMIQSMGGYAIKKNTGNSSAINVDIGDYDYANSNATVKDIVASAKKQNVLCGSYYIYFLVSDGTVPANVNLFSLNTVFEGKTCPSGTISIPNQDTNSCDFICQMQKNSVDWHSTDASGREKLHQDNVKLAYGALGKNAYYNDATGVWNYCDNGGICKNLYTGAYVHLEDAGSQVSPPTN